MPKKIKRNLTLTNLPADRIRMSEVIAEFAQPLLEEAVDNKSAEVAVLMAVACWNVAMMPEDEQEKMIKEVIFKTSATKEEAKIAESVARMLVVRKKELFPHIKKFVVEHDVQFIKGKMVLNVLSARFD